jgi:hypothetical protein
MPTCFVSASAKKASGPDAMRMPSLILKSRAASSLLVGSISNTAASTGVSPATELRTLEQQLRTLEQELAAARVTQVLALQRQVALLTCPAASDAAPPPAVSPPEVLPHGGEVLGVVSRSIAFVSRRTTPTPGERVNGAVSRHATLGKRRVVSFTIATVSSKETSSTLVAPMRRVKPPSRVTVWAPPSWFKRTKICPCQLAPAVPAACPPPAGARNTMRSPGPALAVPLVGVCGRERRAGAGDQRPRRAHSVAILRRYSRRACETCS